MMAQFGMTKTVRNTNSRYWSVLQGVATTATSYAANIQRNIVYATGTYPYGERVQDPEEPRNTNQNLQR